MSTFIVALGLLLTVVLLPFFAYLGLVALAALVGGSGRGGGVADPGGDGPPPRLAVVIPAHDEEAGIAATVRSCLASDYDRERFRVWVIADNCGDGTAARAREAGASVFERADPGRRSKGYALETFFDRATGPWADGRFAAAIVVDADTLIDPGLLRACAAALRSGDDWAQAYYTVRNPDASWRTRLMTYALSLINGALPLGQDRLGLGVGLKGNGMMFSARGLARFPWRAYGLVEDAEFALMLKAAGERVRFLPEARVYGEMVGRGRAAATQRRRWEAGRRSLRGRFAGILARSGRLGPLRKLIYLIDLYLPPLVTLAAAFLATLLVYPVGLADAGLARALARIWPLHAAMGLALLAYLAVPFGRLGLSPRYLAGLVYVPYYAAWKLAVVGRRAPTSWIRTGREPKDAD